MKELHKESWQSWYTRTISGRLVRQASTAVCILNEMIFGLSDQAFTSLNRMFRSDLQNETKDVNGDANGKSCGQGFALLEDYVKKMYQNSGARSHLIDCIGNVLHEYLSTEIWDLPLEFSAYPQLSGEDGDISFHVFNDNAMLHQVFVTLIFFFWEMFFWSCKFANFCFQYSPLYRIEFCPIDFIVL